MNSKLRFGNRVIAFLVSSLVANISLSYQFSIGSARIAAPPPSQGIIDRYELHGGKWTKEKTSVITVARTENSSFRPMRFLRKEEEYFHKPQTYLVTNPPKRKIKVAVTDPSTTRHVVRSTITADKKRSDSFAKKPSNFIRSRFSWFFKQDAQKKNLDWDSQLNFIDSF